MAYFYYWGYDSFFLGNTKTDNKMGKCTKISDGRSMKYVQYNHLVALYLTTRWRYLIEFLGLKAETCITPSAGLKVHFAGRQGNLGL